MTGTDRLAAVPRPINRPGQRRWLRLAGPFAVLLALWVLTGVAHARQEPDLSEPGTLSPSGAGPDGSSALAQLLRAQGVRVERVENSQQAVAAAQADGDATVFVPAPDFLRPDSMANLARADQARRVVVAQPGLRTILYSPVDIQPVRDRWATAIVAPSCSADFATQAGPAAVLNHAYGSAGGLRCYAGGLVGTTIEDTEFIYVGATDPFRNQRIGEAGNAALAVALLGQRSRLIWVDVHAPEPWPRQQEFELPTLPPYQRGDQDREPTGYPLIDAFPASLWASLVLIASAAALLALAQARRLGGPLAEPLAVLVPAAEAVTGRGRLYARIHAREAALQALRSAAIIKLARALDPTRSGPPERDLLSGPDGPPAAAVDFIARVSQRSGQPVAVVQAIVYGPPPHDDADLHRAVAQLDALVDAVLHQNSPDHPGGTL